ncbi:hypothetical protein B0W47_16735 (plasmid) [Komagataeibacter nataicola]|uniref:Uncharacterized protein n=1 Tax=Komagataeibacter nataicola TaxID=265960 RepID=A0A9N7CDZ9_9PROT|nr:hypothetical protein B0W47_16735 [Komagataeibacter nataicola]
MEDPKLAGRIDRISWKDAQTHQKKWHDGLAKKAEKLSEFRGNPDDVTPILNYEGGFQWVKLETPEAKDFEGNAMGNCVGRGGYDDKTIFSLRDKDNFPHVTVEYDEYTKTIQQMKCKGNSAVTDAYMMPVERLINKLKPERITGIDNAISKDGRLYLGLDNIKQASEEGVKFAFDKVNIRNADYAISADGRLYLALDNIKQASEEGIKFAFDKVNIRNADYAISADGRLYLALDNIKQASEEGIKFAFDKVNIRNADYAISADGRLYLALDNIKQASEEGIEFDRINIREDYAISTDGSLYLGYDVIKKVAKTNIKFKSISIMNVNYALSNDGTLYFGEDAIKNIPEGVVLKDVDISNCKCITVWNHKVLGSFKASYSCLTNIGSNAEFGGSVDIINTHIPVWNHKVRGDFKAWGSSLITIGPDASFGGSVHIERCYNLTEFNHKVEGDLIALCSNLTTIGQNADFGGSVYIEDTPLSKKNGISEVRTPEEKQTLKDACKSGDGDTSSFISWISDFILSAFSRR